MIINSSDKQYNIHEKDIIIPKPVVICVNYFDEVAVKEFREKFQMAIDTQQEYIPIYIDSPGGYVASVFAMIDIISEATVPVVTVANGLCMSAGAILLSAGTEGFRFAAPLSQIMLHDAASLTGGKQEDILNEAAYLSRLQEQIYSVLDINCNKKEGFFRKYIKKARNTELYLDASEARKINLCNHVGLPKFTYDIKYNLKLR